PAVAFRTGTPGRSGARPVSAGRPATAPRGAGRPDSFSILLVKTSSHQAVWALRLSWAAPRLALADLPAAELAAGSAWTLPASRLSGHVDGGANVYAAIRKPQPASTKLAGMVPGSAM
ncbi:MAG: hypothetical protein FJZ01_12275, partial [Candidatus Sericytochromatia bacterium]|nr:hypothetical protein [Candidatus Tanganyikabacteria bacterium]